MKKYLGISAILFVGLILRLIFINKPDGLWNDEYVSWMIAVKPFSQGFWSALKHQCHMPFYYLYLKFFMTFFGKSDLLLRMTSVFAGFLSMIAMYFVGLEKNKKTALFCCGFCAISSFLIYYSQEVRLYSILFLFSSLNFLFTLKILKNPDKLNIISYILSDFLILFTHTIGFVYVLFNLIFISTKLFKTFKKAIIGIWTAIILLAGLCAPLILKIFSSQTFSQWWGHFSLSKIGFFITDYFSPVLTNLTNAPDNFFYAPILLPFMLIPSIIAIIGLTLAIKKEKLNRELFFVILLTFLVLISASLSGKLVFLTKYSIEVYPVLIYLVCYGISEISNNLLRKTLIIVYCLISLGYIILHPYSAPKMRRAEGHKIVTDMLERAQLQKDDYILFEYYDKDRFEKYFDFKDYNVISINKGNFPFYLSSNHNNILKNGKNIYKEMFLSSENVYFESMLDKEIFNNMKAGQNLAMVILNSVSFYSPEQIKSVTENKNLYEKTPLLFLVFSYIKKEAFFEAGKRLDISRIEKKGSWTIIKFTKLNN